MNREAREASDKIAQESTQQLYHLFNDPPDLQHTYCRIDNGPWFPAREDGVCYSVDVPIEVSRPAHDVP